MSKGDNGNSARPATTTAIGPTRIIIKGKAAQRRGI